jgi:hypothetical protein
MAKPDVELPKPSEGPKNKENPEFNDVRLTRLPTMQAETGAQDKPLPGLPAIKDLLAQFVAIQTGGPAEDKPGLKTPEKADKPGAPGHPKEKSFFDVPYNKAEADKLITTLASEKFGDRSAAQHRLERMGPQALEQLEAAARNPDAEVRRAARNIITTIKDHVAQEKVQEYFATSETVVAQFEKLLRKVDISMSNQLGLIGGAGGGMERIGPNMVLGAQKPIPPTKEEQREFEALIKRAEDAGTDKDHFKDTLAQLRRAAFDTNATDADKDKYIQLAWLKQANVYGRVLFYLNLI